MRSLVLICSILFAELLAAQSTKIALTNLANTLDDLAAVTNPNGEQIQVLHDILSLGYIPPQIVPKDDKKFLRFFRSEALKTLSQWPEEQQRSFFKIHARYLDDLRTKLEELLDDGQLTQAYSLAEYLSEYNDPNAQEILKALSQQDQNISNQLNTEIANAVLVATKPLEWISDARIKLFSTQLNLSAQETLTLFNYGDGERDIKVLPDAIAKIIPLDPERIINYLFAELGQEVGKSGKHANVWAVQRSVPYLAISKSQGFDSLIVPRIFAIVPKTPTIFDSFGSTYHIQTSYIPKVAEFLDRKNNYLVYSLGVRLVNNLKEQAHPHLSEVCEDVSKISPNLRQFYIDISFSTRAPAADCILNFLKHGTRSEQNSVLFNVHHTAAYEGSHYVDALSDYLIETAKKRPSEVDLSFWKETFSLLRFSTKVANTYPDLLNHEDPEIRKQALLVAINPDVSDAFSSTAIKEALLARLEDKDESIAKLAYENVGFYKKDFVDDLRKRLASSHRTREIVNVVILSSAFVKRSEAVMDLLEQLAVSPIPEVRIEVVIALTLAYKSKNHARALKALELFALEQDEQVHQSLDKAVTVYGHEASVLFDVFAKNPYFYTSHWYSRQIQNTGFHPFYFYKQCIRSENIQERLEGVTYFSWNQKEASYVLDSLVWLVADQNDDIRKKTLEIKAISQKKDSLKQLLRSGDSLVRLHTLEALEVFYNGAILGEFQEDLQRLADNDTDGRVAQLARKLLNSSRSH